MRERSAKEVAWFQLVLGLVTGGVLIWAVERYGWESPWTLWVAFGGLIVALAVNLYDLRSRITRLENQLAERK